jgi:hypothetical protein
MKKISQYVKFISTAYVIHCKRKYILNYIAGQVLIDVDEDCKAFSGREWKRELIKAVW